MTERHYVIAVYLDGSEETLSGPHDSYLTAYLIAGLLWREDYNYGRRKHTPNMGHNSGIMSIKITTKMEDRSEGF